MGVSATPEALERSGWKGLPKHALLFTNVGILQKTSRTDAHPQLWGPRLRDQMSINIVRGRTEVGDNADNRSV